MTTSILSKLIYPRLGRVRRRWKKAGDTDVLHRWPRERIGQYVDNRLADLLRNAAQNVPYYARIFRDSGWDPSVAEKYWRQWPVLSQQALQEHRDELVVADVDKADLYLDASGGSSGFTKTFYHSQQFKESLGIAGVHSDRVAGWKPGSRVAQLWGAPTDVSKAQLLWTRLRSILTNRRLYDSFDMGKDRMSDYHWKMTRYRPDIILAYAGSAFQMARFLKEKNWVPDYPACSIITSAETLTDAMRCEIMKVFQKPVFNRYGSREVGTIAFECELHLGLHVAFTHNLVEVVRPGTLELVYEEEGDILITTLGEANCPLIRYQIGDTGIATEEACICGRNGPRLRKVLGRSSDFITTSDGRRIHGEYFTHVFYGMNKVRQFLLVQRGVEHIEVQLVLSEPMTEEEKSEISSKFYQKVGSEVTLEFKEVERIEPLSSGKRQFTLSFVQE